MPKKPLSDNERRDAEQLQRFKEALSRAFGNTIRKPVSVRLGYQNETGATFIRVPEDRTDQPHRYYFHEAGGNSFQGEAFLQTGALAPWQIRYGTPIRIRKDPLSGEWEIISLDTRYAAQFFADVSEDDGVLIPYDKLAPGLLTQTDPPSMKARVLAGAYRYGNGWKYYNTQETVDWSQPPYNANVPSEPLKARFVLVQLEYTTGFLDYKYGAIVANSTTNAQAYQINEAAGDNSILPLVDTGYFRCGYVRLVFGMDRILRGKHTWALQEYLVLASGEGVLDNLVIDDETGNLVSDSVTGDAVYIE
jgi:hypothetical protein